VASILVPGEVAVLVLMAALVAVAVQAEMHLSAEAVGHVTADCVCISPLTN
jgi:hypothetical protein